LILALSDRPLGASLIYMPDSKKNIVNAFTIDVEDYFHVSAFEPYIDRDTWGNLPRRVTRNTNVILELLNERQVQATFFVLGWVAERHPELIRDIVQEGHEVASHGFSHVRIGRQTPEEFRTDVTDTKKLLEDIAGIAVSGFRAASFSVVRDTLWATAILREAGYKYSSSVYPVHHDLYGIPEAPRFAFRHAGSGLLEVPITTLSFAGRNLPFGGGGYFRLFPYPLSRWAFERINKIENRPAVFYCHPWEIDPEQPRQPGLRFKARFRHYHNLTRMKSRLARLLADFKWSRMDKVFSAEQNEKAPEWTAPSAQSVSN